MLDTSSLSGVTATLAFDFIGNDGDTGNNTVTISDFYTDGALNLTSSSIVNGVTLTTPSPPGPFPIQLTDSALFNEFLQPMTLKTTLSFTVELTEQQGSGGFSPDSFAFFLLDASYFPLFATDDPTGGDALFAVDIDGSSSGIRYSFTYADSGQPVTWMLEPVTVPLPSTALLIGAGLLGGLAARRRSGFCAVGRA